MKKSIILLTLLVCVFPAFAQDLRADKAMTHYNWGNEFSGNAEYSLAILEYNGTIGLMPDYYRAYYRRGNAYYMSGEFEKAINDYDTALKLFPDYAEAYFNRGIAYFFRGGDKKTIPDIKKAIEDWEAVLRIEPNNAQAKEYLERARKLLEQMQGPPVVAATKKPVTPPVAEAPSQPRYNITIYTYSYNNNTSQWEMQTPHAEIKVIPENIPGTNK